MLQNPSKYHPNPLSHFLALHNSQTAHHNAASHPALPIASTGHHPFQQEHTRHNTMTNHHHNHHQQLKATNSHLMDANTTLDAGKSFTIAAILGLQKSAIESNRKDYSVINLSLNNNNNNNNSNNNNNNNNSSQHSSQNHHVLVKSENFLGKHTGNISNGIQNFNCDTNATLNIGSGGGAPSSLASRYLPTAIANSSAASAFGATHQQQQQHPSNATQLRVNSFAAAAAVAAAAAANMTGGGTPTALQSLQQLHQHHAQQSNLHFQREKIKADNHPKKSSLKNKRVRTIFTPEQLERLEAEFERQQYMVGPERLYLAHTLQLTEAQVKVWFQNRRIKWRKHHLEITQQRLALLRQSQLSTSTDMPSNQRTITATPSCEEPEDLNNTNSLREMGEGSRQASESDLSICNDSNDADSYIDGDET